MWPPSYSLPAYESCIFTPWRKGNRQFSLRMGYFGPHLTTLPYLRPHKHGLVASHFPLPIYCKPAVICTLHLHILFTILIPVSHFASWSLDLPTSQSPLSWTRFYSDLKMLGSENTQWQHKFTSNKHRFFNKGIKITRGKSYPTATAMQHHIQEDCNPQ